MVPGMFRTWGEFWRCMGMALVIALPVWLAVIAGFSL